MAKKPTKGQGPATIKPGATPDTAVVNGSFDRVTTLEELLKAANVDLNEWEVERWKANNWENVMKLNNQPVVTLLWQVTAWLQRKVPLRLQRSLDSLQITFNHRWKPAARPKTLRAGKENHMLELALFDVHFGKLAWGAETEEDYDVRIAKTIYQTALTELLGRVENFNIDKILMPIGQDFFHVNSSKNTTFNGTPQDVDTRMQKIFDVGYEAVIEGINACLQFAPVEVLWVPGNHDRETSWYLVKVLQAFYRNIPDVTINDAPTLRKYKRYGINLLGFTHGDGEKFEMLPNLMASEAPADWAASACRVWHVGHWHHKKELRFKPHDEHQGVRIQVIPSLSGTDAWHYYKGFVKNQRAAEAYLWGETSGYVGHFSANVR